MATVTREFKANFDTWAADRIRSGIFTDADMDEFKTFLRKDLTPGPDQLRKGLTITENGVERSSAIDDREERYLLWSNYFAGECRMLWFAA